MPRSPVSIASAVEQLRRHEKPCLRLIGGGDGRSRLGGVPDMRGEWPRHEGRPMCMVAQLDLADMRAAGGPAWLPPEGRLLFFYSLEHGGWGLDTRDAGSFLVRHETGPAELADQPHDLIEEARFPPYPIAFTPAVSFPSLERTGVDWRRISAEDENALEAALDALAPADPAHQVGGYPSAIQDDAMEHECDRITRDIIRRTAKRGKTAPASAPSDWRLLLQLDTDRDAGMMWGDTGRLYFWVREQDARAGDFSKSWLVLQCY